MLWHVGGTPARPRSDGLSLSALARDFVGAPSAIRTRDLLLRRQSLYPLSYRGWTWPTSGALPAGDTARRACPDRPSLAGRGEVRAWRSRQKGPYLGVASRTRRASPLVHPPPTSGYRQDTLG